MSLEVTFKKQTPFKKVFITPTINMEQQEKEEEKRKKMLIQSVMIIGMLIDP